MPNNYFPYLSPRTLRGYLFVMILVLIITPLIWRSQNQLSEKVETCQEQQKVLEQRIKDLEDQIRQEKSLQADVIAP